MTDYLTPAFVGVMGGILVQIIAKLVDYILQKRKIIVDDETSLRKDLMEERQKLVSELRGVAERCDKLEKENASLNDQMVKMKKEHADESIELKRRIYDLEQEVERLQRALAVYEH
jgi:predicted nuclease with TOPRIM domain